MLTQSRIQILAVSSLVLFIYANHLGYCSYLLSQEKLAPTPAPSGAVEFPLILQQTVTAGKTLAGTKIEAKLEVATMVNGAVIPRNAVFSGEVIESLAKTKTDPSRIAVRMDSIRWKGGSAQAKVYLTAWYYPTQDMMGQDLQYGPPQSPKGTWNGQGEYPDPNSKSYKPFPGSDTGKESGVPATPNAKTSNHRVRMKDVESMRGADGSIALLCKRSNLNLDKLTAYVFSSSDLMAPK